MGPETTGSNRLRAYMLTRGWLTVKIPGGKFLSGFPDLFCWHPKHKLRLIETKVAKGKLRPSQCKFCIKAAKFGLDVWVCFDEKDYHLLFKERNWIHYQ